MFMQEIAIITKIERQITLHEMIQLSILICTLPKRSIELNNLLKNVKGQVKNKYEDLIEIIVDDSVKDSTGKKRNNLLHKSKGKFIVYIDDDDDVNENYVESIIDTINKNDKIDCIGINGIITFGGENTRKWFISKDYGKWYESNLVYYRTPNHISPVRREIAVKAGFIDAFVGEDFAYSMAILPHLKIEEKILTPLYHYKFKDKISVSNNANDGGVYRPAWR